MMQQSPNRWTPEEDNLLRREALVQLDQGGVNDWQCIAGQLPNRTNKDCRKRWHNVVSGGMNKGSWTEAEDRMLTQAIQAHGKSWTVVAEAVTTRNPDQCSKRWKQVLDPELNRGRWSDEENQRLIDAYREKGSRWKEIQTEYFPTRSRDTIRNQHIILSRRRRRTTKSSHSGPTGESGGAEIVPGDVATAADDNNFEELLDTEAIELPSTNTASQKPDSLDPTDPMLADPSLFQHGDELPSFVTPSSDSVAPHELPPLPDLDLQFLFPENSTVPSTLDHPGPFPLGPGPSSAVARGKKKDSPGKITLTVQNPSAETVESLMHVAMASQSKLTLEKD